MSKLKSIAVIMLLLFSSGVRAWTIDSGIGASGFQGSGLWVAVQVSPKYFDKTSWNIGAEFNYSLFEMGKLLQILAVPWYDLIDSEGTSWRAKVGAGAGVGFCSGQLNAPPASPTLLIDLWIGRVVSEPGILGLSIRPTWQGGRFYFTVASMMRFSL